MTKPIRLSKKNCLQCSRIKICPIIAKWVEETQSPIEAASFSCSEYLRQELPEGIKSREVRSQ